MKTQYIGFDQYGTSYHNLIHPRKDLLAQLGYNHADKIYRDRADGTARHVGYVIGGRWIEVFKIEPMNPWGGSNHEAPS